MQSYFSTLFLKLDHALFGPRPDFEDAFHLLLAFLVVLFLLKHTVNWIIRFFIFKHITQRAQKSLAKAGAGLGLEIRKKDKTTVREGVYHQRMVRLSTCDWRGMPQMALTVDCQVPDNFRLRINPHGGWVLNTLLNATTLRWQDLRQKEPGVARFLTGDPVFDEAYLTRSNQAEITRGILTPEIRTDLVAGRGHFSKAPTITITPHEVKYAIQTNIFTTASAKRLMEKLDVVCALAKAVETPRVKKLSLAIA